jgi:glyoxylase-like metal-dependent hydrolase (beta-lactamase superfamily II)
MIDENGSGEMNVYDLDVLIVGFPGKTSTHGGLGWSTVALLRGADRTILVDTGPPQYVNLLRDRLAAHGVSPDDVTDVLSTHLHWDHISNVTMFPRATITIGRHELQWAKEQPPGTFLVPDLHVQFLDQSPDRVRLVVDEETFLPGITAYLTPGHTPGHVAYAVKTNRGPVIFAGDAVKNRYELATESVDSSLDFEASRRSVRRLRALMEKDASILIPGHDVSLALADEVVVAMEQHHVDFEVFLSVSGGSSARVLD